MPFEIPLTPSQPQRVSVHAERNRLHPANPVEPKTPTDEIFPRCGISQEDGSLDYTLTLTGPADLPPGEYAIVELLGHTTLVGRIAECERFGTKMMAIEVLCGGRLLPPVYQGGSSIYRLTPCSTETAWENQLDDWSLPPTIRSLMPRQALIDADQDDWRRIRREDIEDAGFGVRIAQYLFLVGEPELPPSRPAGGNRGNHDGSRWPGAYHPI